MNTTLEKLKERIKDKKYKLTTQRQTILQAFIDAEEKHLSAEDVYVLVKAVAPDIGLATIYRTLDLFTELDLLKRLDFGVGGDDWADTVSGRLLGRHAVGFFKGDFADALVVHGMGRWVDDAHSLRNPTSKWEDGNSVRSSFGCIASSTQPGVLQRSWLNADVRVGPTEEAPPSPASKP